MNELHWYNVIGCICVSPDKCRWLMSICDRLCYVSFVILHLYCHTVAINTNSFELDILNCINQLHLPMMNGSMTSGVGVVQYSPSQPHDGTPVGTLVAPPLQMIPLHPPSSSSSYVFSSQSVSPCHINSLTTWIINSAIVMTDTAYQWYTDISVEWIVRYFRVVISGCSGCLMVISEGLNKTWCPVSIIQDIL